MTGLVANAAGPGVLAVPGDVPCLVAVVADLGCLLGCVELAVAGHVAWLVAEVAKRLGGAVLCEVSGLAAVVAVLLLSAIAGDVAGLPATAAERLGGAVAGHVAWLVAILAQAAEPAATDKRAPAACVALASAAVANFKSR